MDQREDCGLGSQKQVVIPIKSILVFKNLNSRREIKIKKVSFN
jgi:hypothetical protein